VNQELFSFRGRMRRKHYVLLYFSVLAIFVIIGLLQRTMGINLSLITFLFVAALIPSSVRRLHDIGYSGWLVIGVILIPCASLLLLIAPGESGPNQYGANPRTPGADLPSV
jgi:uncharacterized membrane protein YhaH (DUF805 family)